jgi:hypothetical protein
MFLDFVIPIIRCAVKELDDFLSYPPRPSLTSLLVSSLLFSTLLSSLPVPFDSLKLN